MTPDTLSMQLDPRPGEVICGRFKIIEQLGEPGTTAIAYSALDEISGEIVVCKIAFDSSGEQGRHMLRSQLRRLRQMASRDVVRAFDVFEHVEAEHRWLVLTMELVLGPTVEEWLKSSPPVRQRLEVFSRASGALSAMHRVGLVHGDFHLGNIVMVEDRVVLIDPEAESVGSVRRAIPHERIPIGVDGDLRGLAAAAKGLLSASEAQVIAAIYKRLCDDPPSTTAETVASYTAAVLSAYLPGEASSLKDAVRYSGLERDSRWTLYREIRAARDLAFEDLGARIATIGAELSVERVHVPADQGTLQRERDSDTGERGVFADRILHFKSADGDQWVIRFDSQSGFRKPWPPGMVESNAISMGKSQIAVGDEKLLLHDLVLRFEEHVGRMYVAHPRHGPIVPFDQCWIEHCLYVLVGLRASLKDEPFGVQGVKPFKESAVDVQGLAKSTGDLRDAIGRNLTESFKAITGISEFRQGDRSVLDLGSVRGRNIIMDVTAGVLNKHLPYIDRVYCIDVSPTSGKVETFEVHVGLKPVGTAPETWTFPCRVG